MFFINISQMNSEVVVRNVIGFLFPVEAIYVFTVVNRSIRLIAQECLKERLWEKPAILLSDQICVEVKARIRTDDPYERYILLNDLWLGLTMDPDRMLNARAINGDGLLHFFCRKGEVSLASLIIRHMLAPSVLNCAGASGMTALHCAAYARSEPLVRLLIKLHANPGIKDSIGRFPEDWATIQQMHDMADLLRRARKGKHGVVVKR